MRAEEIQESAKMFVEQNAWMFRPEGMADAAHLIALMIADAERRGWKEAEDKIESEPVWDYTLCKAETGYSQDRLGEYRRSTFSTHILNGWEPHLFSDGQVIMRRKVKEAGDDSQIQN